MFRKNNTVTLLVIFSLINLLLLMIISFHDKPKAHLSYNCSSTFAMQEKSDDFSASFNVFINMRDDNTGYFDIAGETRSKNEYHTLARAYSFSYQRQKGDIYHLFNISMAKRPADNSIDSMVDKLIFSISPESGRYVKITSFENAYLISNLYSPAFICLTE